MIVEVVNYDTNWPRLFTVEQDLLSEKLGEIAIRIYHIGSTAVPGLSAKPIIDILIEVSSLEELDKMNDKIESLGYEAKGEFGITGRRYFRKGVNKRTHQIHAFQIGDPNIIRHIAFRDYLIANKNIAKEYGNLKSSIAKTCGNDIDKYCNGKDAFVKYHESIALQSIIINLDK